jgi:hypothetical protein
MKPCRTCFEGKRGDHVVSIICMNASHPSFKKLVYPKICENCLISRTPSETPQKPRREPPTISPLGTLTYARTGWEPPPAPPGWHLDDSDPEAWKLVPDRSICCHLTLAPGEIGACGYRRVTRHCGLVDSFIGPTTCTKCQRGESVNGTW